MLYIIVFNCVLEVDYSTIIKEIIYVTSKNFFGIYWLTLTNAILFYDTWYYGSVINYIFIKITL